MSSNIKSENHMKYTKSMSYYDYIMEHGTEAQKERVKHHRKVKETFYSDIRYKPEKPNYKKFNL